MLVAGVLWIGGIAAGVVIGREKGRLTEAIVLAALIGILGVILIAVLPAKPVTGSGSRSLRTKPPPIPKTDHARGYMACGCAVLCVLGLGPLFFGLGFGGGGTYYISDVLFFGSILAVPCAVCTYSSLTYFGLSDSYAKMWSVIVFSLMFAATWIFLHQIAIEGRRLRGF
jgi:hypothetical protein